MDIGPESHEMVEHAAHEVHHQTTPHHENEEFIVRCAVITAILAVFAAISSLLAGHTEASAILLQAKASDSWAYYQASSMKGHLYEINGQLVTALGKPDGASPFEKGAQKYNGEKEETAREARALEKESAREFERHVRLAVGVSCFQIGVVLVSVAMLTRKNPLVWGALASGTAGLIFSVLGLV